MNPLLISVVRDEAMYRRCIADNKFCDGCERLMFDNRAKNESIPVLYNRTLACFDCSTPRWLVFAHEDFETREPLAAKLAEADPSRIYGVIGGRASLHQFPWFLGGVWSDVVVGQIEQSAKDGSNVTRIGTSAPMNTELESVDCQFLAVHSSLVERFHLRFDERLSFDLYAEDFCINAFVCNQVRTALLPLACCHHSGGSVQPRFFKQLVYLNAKYPAPLEFFGSMGWTIGGGKTFLRRCQKRLWAFVVRFAPFYVKWRCRRSA